ncbi:hypothetical protein DDZ14_16190 [Maritimibacter sp. 55A14]|uniref:3TM-type holin n=1 Tax=Maritimibacter sp. 55A14 TaxID=2174844 RepID=UPI000D61E977|nr:3TM-type holin [Maritimibacter sp. 55A14]PWE29979.1 hypothetical protein DDZ14_16190 [Maritimibacter sp. 55A14]
MSVALISLAAAIGAPLIEKILAGRIGAQGAGLAREVVETIARRAGTTPDGLEALARDDPEMVKTAMRETEQMSPELIALYASGLEGQFKALLAERGDPVWVRAWRPMAMYGFGALWFWNVIFIHVANAIWKISLPQTDLWLLFQLNSVYMGLYMGGHTLKDMAKTRWGANGKAAL